MSTDPVNELTFLCGGGLSVLELQYCDVPFSEQAVSFCAELSHRILTSQEAKQFPDLVTFAFYCRKANLEKLRGAIGHADNRLGWGSALHIAPSNIPINFAYSFLFGLLAGNGNVVRVPTKSYAQITIFCGVVNELFRKTEYQVLAQSNAFVRFSRDAEFLHENIGNFDIILVWGGDNTVSDIRRLPRAPRSVEVAFADRYSFAVIGAQAVLDLNAEALQKLCSDFFNDTYLVDQNACSSPNLICWQGECSTVKSAKERFWSALQQYLETRYEVSAVQTIDKQIRILKYLDQYISEMSIVNYGPAITVATMNEVCSANHELKGIFGLFFELESVALEDVLALVNKKYQTLSYFGVDSKAINDTLFKQRCKGVDRIVPLGQALDMGIVWDGYNLIHTLSRIITVI